MSDELWYVKLANGDVHRVTLDQLDGAFQAGHIDESTMVLAAGASQWSKLGDLAGLDDDAAPAPQAHHAAPAPQYAPAPQAYVAPQYAASAPQAQYIPRQAPYVAPAPTVARASAYAAAPGYAAPAQAAAYAAPRAAVPAAPSYVANSLRPMSMDLGDAADYDMPFPRRSRKGWVAAVVGLAAVAGGVAFAANSSHFSFGHLNLNFGSHGGDDLATVAAAAAMAAPPPADPVVSDPTPATPPQAAPSVATSTPSPVTAQAEGSPLNPQFTTRANEDAQQKLAASDKTHGAKSKAHHSGGGGAVHASSKPKSSTFTTGGNKYDPMNSSI